MKKLIQIMPYVGWLACFDDGDGRQCRVPVAAYGLYDDGSTAALIHDDTGGLEAANESTNFLYLSMDTP